MNRYVLYCVCSAAYFTAWGIAANDKPKDGPGMLGCVALIFILVAMMLWREKR